MRVAITSGKVCDRVSAAGTRSLTTLPTVWCEKQLDGGRLASALGAHVAGDDGSGVEH